VNELWIEKKPQRVDVFLSDGSSLGGEVFLLSETLSDVLNGQDTFIPVKIASGVLLLNISQIVSITIKAQWERDNLITLGNKYPIHIKMVNGREMEGDIFANLPESFFRVKDFLDQPLSFLSLFQPGFITYFNKKFILSAQD